MPAQNNRLLKRILRPSRLVAVRCWLLVVVLLGACSAENQADNWLDLEQLLEPPRLLTQTAIAAQPTIAPATPTVEVADEPVETATDDSADYATPDAQVNQTIQVWINQTSEEHVATFADIGDRFESEHGVQVEFVFIDSRNIVSLALAAQENNQLPDIIVHNWEQAPLLQQNGILDAAAAQAVIDKLGEDTFQPSVFESLPDEDGDAWAIPSDGWKYLLFYRADWFAEKGLEIPASLQSIKNSAEIFDTIILPFETVTMTPTSAVTTPDPEATPQAEIVRSGIVIPTEQDLPSTQRVYEWIVASNGCELADESGQLTLDSYRCQGLTGYYLDLVNRFGPPDYQTDITALLALAESRTAMAILPPSAFAYIAANGEEAVKENVAVVGHLEGKSSLTMLNYVGIVSGAERAASSFASFWFEDAYLDILAIEPEMSYPMRRQSAQVADVVKAWQALPIVNGQSLDALYPPDEGRFLVSELIDLERLPVDRWGSNGNYLLASEIAEDLTIAPILQHMLSGYIDVEQAQDAMIDDIAALSPTLVKTPQP